MQGMVGELEPEQENQVRMIHSSGEHLLELINELLDMARIESGRMNTRAEALDVAELVTDVAESVAPLAKEKGLELTWDVAPDTGDMVSDRRRMEQVLLNLLGNGIKFTASGSVRITAARDGDTMVFVVSDTGLGISEEDLELIFEEFYQVHDPDIAKVDGTGLGLSVSKRLIGLLGGTIEVESELGAGATFTVRVPVAAAGSAMSAASR